MEEINQIKKELEELRNKLRIIESAERDSVFQNRGFLKGYNPVADFWASSVDEAGSDAGFRRNISLVLNGEAQTKTFTVPAYPTKWRKLQNGSELYIPLFAYNSRY